MRRVQNILAKLASPGFAPRWGSAIAGAGVEEILKVLGVVAIALVARATFTGVVDGFVYGALVGLGFQVVENIVFAVNAVAVAGGSDRIGPVVGDVPPTRVPGRALEPHPVHCARGAGVAYAFVRRDRAVTTRLARRRRLPGLRPPGSHFLWNSPILVDGFGYGVAGILAALLTQGDPGPADFPRADTGGGTARGWLLRGCARWPGRPPDGHAVGDLGADVSGPARGGPPTGAIPARESGGPCGASAAAGTGPASRSRSRAIPAPSVSPACCAVAARCSSGATSCWPLASPPRTPAPARHYLTLGRRAVIIAMAAVIASSWSAWHRHSRASAACDPCRRPLSGDLQSRGDRPRD